MPDRLSQRGNRKAKENVFKAGSQRLSFVLIAGGEVEGRAKSRRTVKDVGQGWMSYAREHGRKFSKQEGQVGGKFRCSSLVSGQCFQEHHRDRCCHLTSSCQCARPGAAHRFRGGGGRLGKALGFCLLSFRPYPFSVSLPVSHPSVSISPLCLSLPSHLRPLPSMTSF